MSETVKKILEAIAPVEIKQLGGAGNKCCKVATGTLDAYLRHTFGLKHWDLCAPEVIIKAMGGKATNFKHQRLVYPIEGNQQIAGLILARNSHMYDLIIRRLGPLLATLKEKFE